MFLSFFFFVSRTFLVAFGCFAPLLLFFCLSFFFFEYNTPARIISPLSFVNPIVFFYMEKSQPFVS